MPSLFSLKNVRFKDIIHYPDMEIPQGAATFICGESGSGKSTLLKLLNGIVSAETGEVLYSGRHIEDYDPVTLRRDVLLCGQSTFLFDKSVQENFIEYYKYRDLHPINQDKINTYLKICAANFRLDALCVTMSGGERQRVFTAICLSLRPKVFLLDEPTSALDDMTANTMMSNIKAFCNENNITLIVVSHNRALAQAYADNTIMLAGGIRHE
ncbi:MAG: energy-coupling factor ABC transporter ATP-binding protein [Chitinispirillales bacterium]|jgi:putative ABC transport system ATP-binding protein|nr:energy-coupling factor ABC transporter ATP-binding protein [Chitinispirillales bacterium]